MRKGTIILIMAFVLLFAGCAKKPTTEVVAEEGTVEAPTIVNEEPVVEPATNTDTTQEEASVVQPEVKNEEPQTVYRVQVFAGYSEANANKVAEEVRQKLPNVPVHVVHIEPYYKVRVGDCKTPEEAAQLLEKCKALGYEDAWKTEDILIPGE